MAPPRAQHNAKKGTVLVSFFGDSSYGWYEHHLLSEFWAKFEENSQQKEKKKVGTNWHHAASHSAQMRPHTSILFIVPRLDSCNEECPSAAAEATL